MPRGDQLARQWRIIQSITASHTGRSAAELADELDCNPRTVYRDLEALQVAGFPLYTERVDGKNLWSLLDVIKHHIPIPFSFPELMALYFSRDMLKALQDTVYYDSIESLFQKIKTTLPPDALKFLHNVQKSLYVKQKHYKQYGKFKEIINRVNEAALQKRSIKIIYFTLSRREETQRKVDPYKIWYFNGSFYLVGQCHKRNDIRTFALERIKMLTITKEKFTVPDDFSIEELARSGFGVIRGKPEKVRIRFDKDIADYIGEKIWHESQKIIPQKNGSIILELTVAVNDELKNWIMSWGSRAEVLEPQLLADEIQAVIHKMFEKYTKTKKSTKDTSHVR